MIRVFIKYGFCLAAAFLLQSHGRAMGQELPGMKNECESHISILGSSNVNTFELVNDNPRIAGPSGNGEAQTSQRIEIPVKDFEGASKRMREDFREMVNASEYPFIVMNIESRNLDECLKAQGLSDFKTEIIIAGVSQSYVVPCRIDSCPVSGFVLEGSLTVKLTDFGIDPPVKFLGLVKVNNQVRIDYVFRFQADDPIFGMP